MITMLSYYMAKYFFRRYYEDEGKDTFVGIFMIETFIEFIMIIGNIIK